MLREFLLKKDVSVDPPIYKNAGVKYTVWGAMCVEFLEQAHTSYDLLKRVMDNHYNDADGENDIVVRIDCDTFDNDDFIYI